jgi:phosphate transport system permease protein
MAATKPAFNPPGKKGDMIFSALVKLAALIVLLMLGGIIVSDFLSWPSIQKFGFSFLWTKEWDAPNEIFGALVPIYGHAGDLIYRAADRRSGELWYRAVPDGARLPG